MSGDLLRVLILVCVFGMVVLAVERAISTMSERRTGARAINERLKLIARYENRDRAYMRLRRSVPSYEHLPKPFSHMLYRFSVLVRAAGIRRRPETVMLWMAAIAAGTVAGGLVLAAGLGTFLSPGVLLLLLVLSGAAGVALPLLYVSRLADSRRRKLVEQFPVALDIFVRSLRAGHPIFSALKILEREMSDPLGSEFGMVSDEINYGLTLRDALQNMAERCDTEDIDMFVVCVSVQGETGGNLAEILSNLATVIRDRAAMLMKVRALSSEGRMTGLMLTALPVVTLVGMFILNPRFYLDVAGDPAFVPGFLGLIVCFLVGVFWIRRIVDLKV